MMLTLEQARDGLAEVNEKYFTSRASDATLPPVFFLFRPDGMDPITAPFDGDHSKDITAACIREIVATNRDIYMIAFVNEAWMKIIDGRGAPPNLADLPSPSECEDRQEVVMIHIEARDGGYLADIREIVRDWTTGKVVSLKPFEMPPSMDYAGRFMHLFD